MDSVVVGPPALVARGHIGAPAESRSSTIHAPVGHNPANHAPANHNVVGLSDRRPHLVDLDLVDLDLIGLGSIDLDRPNPGLAGPGNGRTQPAPEPESAPAPGQLLRDLLRAAQLLREELEGRLLAVGGNLHAWSVLSALEAEDRVSQRVLSEVCGIDAPSVTRVVDRLEAQDFVKRRRDVDDRRVVRVRLTGKGRLHHLHLARVANEFEEEMGVPLEPCFAGGLRSVLGSLDAARREHPAKGSRR